MSTAIGSAPIFAHLRWGNVYPAEVERVLRQHPDIADVAVIGVPDEKWGETVKAVVVPAEGSAPDGAELIAFTRDRLAHYKCPTSVSFVLALPRNPTGKVLKRQLRSSFQSRRQDAASPAPQNRPNSAGG